MDVKQYIASGDLELYVAGKLTPKENLEVHELAMKHPEIASEIVAIEKTILALSKTAAPNYSNRFEKINNRINPPNDKVMRLDEKNRNWSSYLGWAASVLLAIGLYWMYDQNNKLASQIEVTEQQQIQLEQEIIVSNSSLEATEEMLNAIRDKNTTSTILTGQKVSPNSYAKAYWNKKEQKVFIDAQGLPEPPDGMVYQVWSLKLNPLTPTSIGLLENFSSEQIKVFALANPNESEAFGITLEPSGGSISPNLDQLYTLGEVASS